MLEISLDGNPGIEVELESSKPDGQPYVADTDRIFDSLRLLRYPE